MSVPLTEEDLHDLYVWVDEIPISRPKRNITRDFSDGCCVAEVMKFFFPKLVELHNYVPAMSQSKKIENWNTLNNRVFRKLHFEVARDEISDITAGVPGAIERFLRALRTKISEIKARREELAAAEALTGVPGTGLSPSRFRYGARHADRAGTAGSTLSAHDRNVENEAERGQRGGSKVGVTSGYANTQGRSNAAPNVKSGFDQRNGSARTSGSVDDGIDSRTAASLRQLFDEKDRTIAELRETVGLLSEKVMKLEELVRLKDNKLHDYRSTFGHM
ncbi:Spef1 [Trypanosoma equiperdum]|uniref:Calponin-homology (CH) domain-containing protein n=5 Tax=Trypanozoon TaxID=39700 RepID=Q583Z0_TRYB2|nr:hypothetical protein, conserved [Trypanosoma brucei gambiense DAL972]XP_844463.1 hypothetical protein, conserved [Trypanosoma brucei brucei TREU927]AAX56302.1 SPEF1-like protein [Trypanosoma brucei rhodesiense]AAX79837.1 hypothetical protein, conserved [Trypanosoma brucei]RHW72771.1 Spef1 [Trypanosoma brucei equiperdum]SCU67093.1 Spef1 [Trypanosoma equiperdum]AAZ10904.1 hypothetical protein, conserved [Trypanosoma brucei brucei TREU927]|eukprot:XP_011772902.1 hypothetical protein, conserved [Trypanosoma brucei gambiense DAL972]